MNGSLHRISALLALISLACMIPTQTAWAALVFQESGGQVVMEAENADANIPREGKIWTLATSLAGESGSGYLTALPNSGTAYASAGTAMTMSPELQFQVQFTTPGTYYIWVRGHAGSTLDDALHAGIDGTSPATADKIKLTATGAWNWTKTDTTALATYVVVPSAGLHAIHLWMNEDGFSLDKLVLTTSTSYAPAGTGPAESARVNMGGDTTPPTGSVSINSGAQATKLTAVTLTLSATDTGGVTQMQFSNTGSSYSTAEAYATSKSWTLASGDGTKTVYVKFKDAAGNWSAAFTDTITLDTVAPGITITSPSDGAMVTP